MKTKFLLLALFVVFATGMSQVTKSGSQVHSDLLGAWRLPEDLARMRPLIEQQRRYQGAAFDLSQTRS